MLSPTYYYHRLSTIPTLVCSNFYGPHDWFQLILSPDWNVPSFSIYLLGGPSQISKKKGPAFLDCLLGGGLNSSPPVKDGGR